MHVGGGMHTALGLMLFLVSMASVRAEDQSVEFAGETYHLDYHDRAKHPDGSAGDGIAEFTLEGETVNDWSKLFAYHIYPEVPADPALAAETLGKTVKDNNKDANYSLTKDDKSGEAIVDFLTRKWARELDYCLRKELWCFTDNRISVRFEYESHDSDGQWWRSHGNEHWDFDELGYMRRRDASINDVKIDESERRYFGPRPESEYGLDIPLW